MNAHAMLSFSHLWALGYHHLTPIVPPGAPVSERSSLHKRIAAGRDDRGKAPGIKGGDGDWRGFDWLPYQADERDIARWQDMGAGVGIKTGHDGVILIDADTLNEQHAEIIRDTIHETLGQLPVRIGRYPKVGYLLRVEGELRYTRIEFGERNDKGNLTDRVEILSHGRQFVAMGVHPATQLPYRWPQGMPPLADLKVVQPDQIASLLNVLRERLPSASPVIQEGADTKINQESLKGDPALIRKAVAAIPNDGRFSTRESYRDIGYAVKAALPDHEDEALEIFQEWCGRWTDGTNEPELVQADWSRMKPPYRRGAGYLYELAEKHAPDKFSKVEVHFQPLPDEEPENPFAIAEQRERAQADLDTYPVLKIGDIMNRPPPVFLIARHIPEASVGFLYSEPGVGKTFITLDMSLHIAASQPTWHGDAIATDGRPVIYIASEGSYGFRNRIKAWAKRRNLTIDDERFLMIEHTINFMQPEDVEKLVRTVKAAAVARPALVVVDTVSRAMPGADENLQKDMTLFVQACDRVKTAFKCAVLGVHHAGKSGDMRGSTVLRGAGDYVFRLSRKPGLPVGHLSCEKQKDAPDGWSDPYRFDMVTLDEGQTSLVPTRVETSAGPQTEASATLSRAILDAMQGAWSAGDPWGKTYHAGERQAARIMVREYGLGMDRAEEMLLLWEQTGLVRVDVVSAKNKKRGYRVEGFEVSSGGVFD